MDYLEYKSYTAGTEFSEADGVFFGKIYGITDLVSFESETETGLYKAFADAVDDYEDLKKEIGKKWK